MTIIIRNLMLIAVILCFSSPMQAFEISALAYTSPKALKPRHHEWLAITTPVHEKMAVFALSCSYNEENDSVCHSGNMIGNARDINEENPLVRGSRWNDDPNGFLVSKSEKIRIQWAFWLTDAKKIISKGKAIDRNYPVMYRSHYGDLQFLHAMAPKGTSPVEANKQILSWAKFAYLVANKTIDPSWRLVGTEVKREAPLFSGMFNEVINKSRWTVRDLFTNYKDEPFTNAETIYSNSDVANIALGALLHTVQDSFSNSHTQREHLGSKKVAASGKIIQFHDYETQVSWCHGREDVLPNWLAYDIDIQTNPVKIGAWIIKQVRNRKPWEGEVETFFNEMIFAISDLSIPSDAGFYGEGNEQCIPNSDFS